MTGTVAVPRRPALSTCSVACAQWCGSAGSGAPSCGPLR